MLAGSPDSQSPPPRSRRPKTALAAGILIVAALLFRSNEAPAQHGGAIIEIEKAEPQAEELRLKIEEKLSSKRSFALVLGIDTFDDRAWPRLPGVLKEVQEVQAAFKSHGFQIETNLMGDDEANPNLKPLNAEELNRRIRDFLDKHGRDAANRLVVYVATHGHADKGSDGNPESRGYGYLITKDSPDPRAKNFASRAYSVTKLADELLTVQAQHVYFFFNACFSGAMVPLIQVREKTESGVAQLEDSVADWAQKLLAHNARLILTAGSDDQTVPDVNNPFSKAVIEGLAGAADQNGDGLILGSELASYVRARVAIETRRKQHPNDPVFAFVPKIISPAKPRSDLKIGTIDYSQNGDFVFLSPRGGRRSAPEGLELATLQQRLAKTQSVDCPDCPIMARVSGSEKVSPFSLAQTETTFSQWDACYRDFYCQTWIEDHGLGRGNRPVSGITWQDALQFISWLNSKIEKSPCKEYRLPTPDEWKFAARGNTATRYPWGDRVEPDQANCWNCGSAWDGAGPAPVGRFSPNVFELYDMVGNLWEWVESPDNQCRAADMLADGRCPRDGSVMGGAFSTKLEDISLENTGNIPRTSNDKHRSYRLASVGLRVACTLQKGQAAANSK
jgi:hypothetical protein